jgi:CDP-diacylglycerol--glycerol-3-phosphate 3-phosphatidyltransferase
MNLIPDVLQRCYINLINPLISFFIRHKANPNHLTTLGLIIQFISMYFLATGSFFIGGVLILAAGTCDMIDGKIARSRSVSTKFGALYDSTLDRYAEFAMFFGIGFYLINRQYYVSSIVAFIALGGSLMTSYIRARSEAMGLDCRVGIMQRPERIVYIGFASIFSIFFKDMPYPLVIVIAITAVTSNFTAIQRMVHIYRLTNSGRELLIQAGQQSTPRNDETKGSTNESHTLEVKNS